MFGGDCTRVAVCEAMVRAAVGTFGTVDILVNSIGPASLGTVVDTTVPSEAWDQAFAVNLRAAFLASKYAVPVMAAGRSSTSRRSRRCAATGPSPTRRPRAG
ncbi:MAG TPA: SDR family oxidoreductase [Streptosporangiaceae bacterium]|nr:SDR family oxidoreductase [Streptosporangiaceae bacterium]